MIKFADYFVISGLDLSSGLEPDKYAEDNLHVSPLERSYKTKVLAHYPESIPEYSLDEQAVGIFCLPNGLKFRTQKHSVTQAPTFHSFLITKENGKRLYGFSLIFYEEVRNKDICTAMQTLQAMYITELSSGMRTRTLLNGQNQGPQSRSLPRHFKLNPHNPTGASLTYYDIAKDKLFVSKSIAILCRTAYVQAAKIFLENLYRCSRRLSSSPYSLESYVFNLLYEVELPAPGKSILIHLPPSDPHLPPTNIVLLSPSTPLQLPHLDYSLRLMFMWLGVDIVVQLFACLLLENQILLRSTDCQKLMVVAEGITSLLFPYTWPHVYAPILPASLHHFLDAPVPFLMGLNATSENIKAASEASLCYVDIDKCKVQLPEEIASFPLREAFIAEIWSALDKYGVQVPNSENNRNTQEIMSRSCTLPGKPQNRRKLSVHDTLDSERPPSPPGSARSEALQRIADIVRRTGVTLDQDESNIPADSYIEDMKFNNSIREIFLNRFVHIFQSYENFVIFPSQDKEEWINNRDSMQNFDKSSFLSDQPEQHRAFLMRFLESQMFATLIDNKILSIWGETDNNLVIFDNRIKLLKQRYGGENLMRSLCYEPCTISHDTQKLIERRLTYPDFESPLPREITNGTKQTSSRNFPLLDKEILNKTPVVNKGSIPRASSLKKGLPFLRSNNMSVDRTNANKPANNVQEMSPALLAQTNWTFVEKLLKDCKAKTKRMLLAKLGAEGVTLSSNNSSENVGAVEESTLVASLCDFMERVWSHGLQKKRGKSALWSHLLLYQENHQPMTMKENHFICPAEMSRIAHQLENWNSNGNHLKTDLPNLSGSLLIDIVNIQAMLDVKTCIGKARAWVRLSLEKKLLSKHIRTLLSDQVLLKTLYKRSAFLRCDEEREQFLYHLLSLNAVDYFCFTSTYPTTVIPYRIVIVPSKKGTMTSANVWIVLSGTLSETKRVNVPKSVINFEHRNQNLGVLTTLRIGHDNSGLHAKWMIEYVLVRNDVTGHVYKFPCGRWLGRGVDDGSTERLLVGNLLPPQKEGEETSSCTRRVSSTPPRARSPAPPVLKPELKPSQIQHMLSDCINNIVKWQYRRNSERNTTLTALLCGENGLVCCMENVFLLGFKSTKMFVGKHYLWDYLVWVKEEFEVSLMEEGTGTRSASLERNHQKTVAVWRCFCHLVDEIISSSNTLGKDGKFQLFICLSVREHLLHRMLVPMSNCKITLEMYEDYSFLKNRGLLTFLRQILLPLDELDVVLENTVTHGISLPSRS